MIFYTSPIIKWLLGTDTLIQMLCAIWDTVSSILIVLLKKETSLFYGGVMEIIKTLDQDTS